MSASNVINPSKKREKLFFMTQIFVGAFFPTVNKQKRKNEPKKSSNFIQ